jgi:hypothetical protein
VFFNEKKIPKKNFANIFAMSAATSPLGTVFKSRFLAKSEFCAEFFAVYRKNCVFDHTILKGVYSMLKFKIPTFSRILGNPRKIQNLKARYLRPWAKIQKSPRCLIGMVLEYSLAYTSLA